MSGLPDVRRQGGQVLVVSGEPSGDRIAAGIVSSLRARGVRCFGMGGPASAAAGMLVSHGVKQPAMGLSEILAHVPRSIHAVRSLVREAERQHPVAAVLVNYTEFNMHLGPRLRALGVPVLWCVAPQVWAWRPHRVTRALAAFDRLAVVLPFERDLWRKEGADVHYVGHPALDQRTPTSEERANVRAKLGLAEAAAVALLPGSRAHEVRRHLTPMVEGARALAGRRPLQLRLLLTNSLDAATRAWASAHFARAEVIAIDSAMGAESALPAFDAALVASGTATLESALLGAPPVVVYRASCVTAWAARRLLRVSKVALPNLLLPNAPYPELLQDDLTPARVAAELATILEQRAHFARFPAELARVLAAGVPTCGPGRTTSSARMAALLDTWLSGERAPYPQPSAVHA